MKSGQPLLLDEALVAMMRAFGCEPTCHWCEKHLAVGDACTFWSVPGTEFTTGKGPAVGLSALACADCATKEVTPEVERRVTAEVQRRLEAARQPQIARDRASGKERRGGCFLTAEGMLF